MSLVHRCFIIRYNFFSSFLSLAGFSICSFCTKIKDEKTIDDTVCALLFHSPLQFFALLLYAYYFFIRTAYKRMNEEKSIDNGLRVPLFHTPLQ